jgi:predicted helicase
MMQNANAPAVIEEAIAKTAEMNPLETDGKWLEAVTAQSGPYIKEWDVGKCWQWNHWPEREKRFPGTTNQDIGIDAVAVRRSDGEHIAIQCKSRQLDGNGRGADITKPETDKFANASAGNFWAERWVVTNGDNRLSEHALQVISMHGKPLKMVNITKDLHDQRQANTAPGACEHCANPDSQDAIQTKSCMQDEAVAESVRILREHEQSGSGGLPPGQARGRIILPCGTGKTRISLRIVEALTPPGELSIVLCPSIALVAQIRREYLQHAAAGVRGLAVCSDETAGYDPRKEGGRNTAEDPTADASNVSASVVKGKVTTDATEIAAWIEQGRNEDRVNVIFGTYQSSHRVAEALELAGAKAAVLVADEAHRTAGLRRNRDRQKEQRVRDFTLCHDNAAFPAAYRVYQTATPRVYSVGRAAAENPGDWLVRSMDDETVFGVELYRKSYAEAVGNGWLADYRIIALGVNDPGAYAEANRLAGRNSGKGRNALTSTDYLRGLAFALAMGGATQNQGRGDVLIKSCIAFMNTVEKSKNMAQDLRTDAVKQWVQRWLEDNGQNRQAADYTVEHLDASSNVTAREEAKRKLAESTRDKPYAVSNVGIFGEGTDSPSLNAVAFLEPRKSPIDVIQAVGRAMRTPRARNWATSSVPS